MGQFFDEIPDNILEWIKKQEMFWVATAPLSADGHVNISPKGYKNTIHAISKNQFWWEDLTGSGVETIAHLRDNKRITVMFQAFEGPPRICRLFGTGKVHEYGSEEYSKYIPGDNRHPGSRAVIVVDIHKIGTSCGYAVPFYQFLSHRTQYLDIAAERELPTSKVPLKKYWFEHNLNSIDGLSALGEDTACSKIEFENCWERERGTYVEANEKRMKLLEEMKTDSRKDGKLTTMRAPDWMKLDQKTVITFVLGVLVTSFLNRNGISLI